LCTSSAGKPNSIPLSQPLPGLPIPRYANITDDTYQAQITTLSNGMQVASANKFGMFCTVGVVIDSGSRFEGGYQSGISHFLEKLSFSSTSKYKNRDEILQQLESHGGICDCQGSRDTLIYACSANRRGLPVVVDLLSEVTMLPQITEQEVQDARLAISHDRAMLEMSPDPEQLLLEIIHAAAYRDNTLGLPRVCPEENIMEIDRETIFNYLKAHHTPDRMVLAGVGVEHDELVKLAEQYFVTKTPSWESSVVSKKQGPDLSVSQYTGGLVKYEKDLSSVSLGPTPMPNLAHCVIALQSCSHAAVDKDFLAFCVLNMMMGGGGSFSAGGPGKGMFTRLYTDVLNRFHWMNNATAYNHCYQDSGIFCIRASAHPDQLRELVEVVVKQLVGTYAFRIEETELKRAKTQLQSMLLMNMEARPVVFEDIGRQTLSYKEWKPTQYYYDAISQVTDEDIHRIAYTMLQSSPSVAAYGDLTKLPNLEDIQSALMTKDGSFPNKFRSYFGLR